MKNILMMGPKIPPIHGQSIAFTSWYNYISDYENVTFINSNLEGMNFFKKTLKTFYLIFKILKMIYSKKFDIIYFTCSRSLLGSIKDLVLINLGYKKNIRIINHLHGADFYSFLHSVPKIYKKLLIKSYNKIDTSIVLLDKMKDEFKDFPEMNIEVVNNFYDKSLETDEIKKEQNSINILYLSNIIKSKGIFELLEAIKEINKTYDNVFLHIAGGFVKDEFMNEKEVENKFNEEIKLIKNAEYHGKVFGEKKLNLLKKSHIFVLPSYYSAEAFPISIIEAMRLGNAIITTNHNYLPYIINDKNGIVVKKRDTNSLLEGILYLIKDKSKLQKIQEHNIVYAKENFSEEKYLNKLKEIIIS